MDGENNGTPYFQMDDLGVPLFLETPIYLRSTPHPVTVTTRNITFLVGNPNLNLHLPLASWVGGVDPTYIPYGSFREAKNIPPMPRP